MVSVPVWVVVAVVTVVEDNTGYAGGGLAGCIVGMANSGTFAGTAGTAHFHIGPDTAGTAHSHIDPGTSGNVRSGTDPGTYSGIGLGRCWVRYMAQIHTIVVVDMVADPGIA